jgi:carbamoyltransferase
MADVVLGISAFYHDSAAALVVDGKIIAAAQEERFSRTKHDAAFPRHAVQYVLREAGLGVDALSQVVFYDKPFLKFERLLETYHAFAPRGLGSFLKAMPVWIKDKLFTKGLIRRELNAMGTLRAPVLFTEHHLAHAASAFYPSPFREAAILTVDGVGEWATASIARGSGTSIQVLRELHFPHSLGLLYSAFTFFLGFKVNSGEYKVMGLAPYGQPESAQTQQFREKITRHLVDIRPDGSLLLNLDYFAFPYGLQMTRDRPWEALFGMPRRQPDSALEQSHMNLALAVQGVTGEVMEKLAATARTLTGCPDLVMAGGVALNCVANSRICEQKIFDRVWIQPAAGDAGGALGAALAAGYLTTGAVRTVDPHDSMQGAYLGPAFSPEGIARALQTYGLAYEHPETEEALLRRTARTLAEGNVVGWFQGRMEFGPRALGNRSILADATRPDMQRRLNEKIKLREGFRPFAPAVREEEAACYFELDAPSPYMLLTAPVKSCRRKPLPDDFARWPLPEKRAYPRSDLPAVTHLDFSARVQTVSRQSNPLFHGLLTACKEATGHGVLVNTSFNVRGEPMVCTPEEALRCFMLTDMDYLVIGPFFLDKKKQPASAEDLFPVLAFAPD